MDTIHNSALNYIIAHSTKKTLNFVVSYLRRLLNITGIIEVIMR